MLKQIKCSSSSKLNSPRPGIFKMIMISISGFLFLCAITSCGGKDRPYPNNIFYGTWTRSFFNNSTLTGDTVYLKFTSDSNFQLGTGTVFTQLGTGTYTYTSGQITFDFQTAANGASVCIGTPGTYTYTITNGLILSVVTDTCNASSAVPRSTILGGPWLKQ